MGSGVISKIMGVTVDNGTVVFSFGVVLVFSGDELSGEDAFCSKLVL